MNFSSDILDGLKPAVEGAEVLNAMKLNIQFIAVAPVEIAIKKSPPRVTVRGRRFRSQRQMVAA